MFGIKHVNTIWQRKMKSVVKNSAGKSVRWQTNFCWSGNCILRNSLLYHDWIPFSSSEMPLYSSVDNSCDFWEVNPLRWSPISSSRKCEEGDDFLLEIRAIRRATTSSTPRHVAAMITTPTADFSSPSADFCSSSLWEWWWTPGGGGGAGTVDQEFPPVL